MEENYLIQKLARTCDRDEQRLLVRSHLTRSDPLRPGQVVRQRRDDQLDPEIENARFRILVIGSNTTEAHPVLALR